jgi:hypothetical protein
MGGEIRPAKLAVAGGKTFSLQKVNSPSIFFTEPKLAKWPLPGYRGKLVADASAAKDAGARIYIFDFSILFIFFQRRSTKRPGCWNSAQNFFHQLCQGRSVCVINATCRACNCTCATPDASEYPGSCPAAGNVGRCNTPTTNGGMQLATEKRAARRGPEYEPTGACHTL